LNGYLAWDETAARGVIDALNAKPGALLPVLHELQETFGYIAPDAEPPIAEALNLPHAKVHGVVTFYADFRVASSATHQLKLCRAEACQTLEGDRLAADAAALDADDVANALRTIAAQSWQEDYSAFSKQSRRIATSEAAE
jgi:formate dehydrogenase subunit gamma